MPRANRITEGLTLLSGGILGHFMALYAVAIIIDVFIGNATTTVLDRAAGATLIGLIVLCEAWFGRRMVKTLAQGISPFDLMLAASLPPVPMILRPFVGAWWAYHFCWAILAGVLFAISDDTFPWFNDLLSAMFTCLCTYMSTTYLLLMVSTFKRDSKRLLKLKDRSKWLVLLSGLIVIAVSVGERFAN